MNSDSSVKSLTPGFFYTSSVSRSATGWGFPYWSTFLVGNKSVLVWKCSGLKVCSPSCGIHLYFLDHCCFFTLGQAGPTSELKGPFMFLASMVQTWCLLCYKQALERSYLLSLQFMQDLLSLGKKKKEEGSCDSSSTTVMLFLVHNVKDKSGGFKYHLLKRMNLNSVQLPIVIECVTTAAQTLFQ